MAGRVIGNVATTYDDTPNKVLGVTDVKVVAIKHTGSAGMQVDAIGLVFGKARDGKPGVFILLDDVKMRDNVTVASAHIREGVLDALSKADTREALSGGDSAAQDALGGS